MQAAHLEKLNDGQRAAVVHGIGLPEGRTAGPLLIIAGVDLCLKLGLTQ